MQLKGLSKYPKAHLGTEKPLEVPNSQQLPFYTALNLLPEDRFNPILIVLVHSI